MFGGTGPPYVILQAATAMILVLAANTAYADFPRLCSIIARDGFLPRQLVNRGDRLVFSNGVLGLAIGAAILLVAFGGVTNALIPLYAAGVFTSFTLSQAGMVRRFWRLRQPAWHVRLTIAVVGTATTGLVLVIVVVSKFTSGAWIPVIVIPLVVMLFRGIHRHYQRLSRELHAPLDLRPKRLNHTVVVLVGSIHKGVLQALAYARSLNPNHLLAVHVVSSEEEQEQMEKEWAEYQIDVPLEIALLALPRAVGAHPALPRRPRRPLGQRHHHGRGAGVRGPPLVGARAAQPVGAVPEGQAALPAQHRGHLHPLPPRRPHRRGGGPEPLTSPVGGATVPPMEVQPWR